MTDRQKQMIAAYLPNPPDPELEFMEYYTKDSAGRIIKVRVVSFAQVEEGEICEIVRDIAGFKTRRVLGGWGECSKFPGFYYKSQLYDNKQDCRDGTHPWYFEWEKLRRIQREEET